MKRLFQSRYWQLSENGWLVAMAISVPVIAALVLLSADQFSIKRRIAAREVERWPVAEARIIESQVSEINASTGTGFATRLSVVARFSFTADHQTIVASYSAMWHRKDHRDWSKLMAPGSLLKIRYDAANPKRVSLFDYNRVP
jgi:uncharacterized BrkB/YihY/UPF0761 family membrane protein